MEYINGAISGAFGVIISHPFDTIKTNIQKNVKPNYNIKYLYKGLFPPLFGVGFEKAIVFGLYNNMYKYTDNHLISGAIAGLGASFIVTPFDRFKIMLQNNQNLNNINIKNLFNGLSITFTREIPGFMIYFYVYNLLKNNREISNVNSFIYGGISGATAWLFIYPQDKIKTIIQSSNTKLHIFNIIKLLYNSGYRQLYNGFSYALMRAIPLHAGTFMINEMIKKL